MAVRGAVRPTRARRSGTGWRLTETAACWCSMTRKILICCGRSFRSGGAARVLITAAREPVAELGTHYPGGRVQRRGGAGLAGRADRPGRRSRCLGGGRRARASAAGGWIRPRGDRRAAPGVRGVPGRSCGRCRPGVPGPARRSSRTRRAWRRRCCCPWRSSGPPIRPGVCTGVMEIMAVLSPAAVRRDLLRAAGDRRARWPADGRRVAAVRGGPGAGAAGRPGHC